ncbi:MAG: hypothetical protein JWL64_2570, partial [Frankiales bacterium]|nr:hypothetical protein [Frankiales bacterium]
MLRRAAELDAEPLDEPGHLDEAVLRRAAAEVGLSSEAVDRAVAEW